MSLPPKIKPSSIVNAYLFYAQRLFQFENSPPESRAQADKLALSASVCLCLKQAWQAWLDELGRYLNKSLKDYADLLLAEHRTHPEIETLLNIQKQPDNWLSQLLLCLEPQVQIASPKNESSQLDDDPAENQAGASGLIRLRQIDDASAFTESALTVSLLNEAEQFKKLIEEFKRYINSVRSRQEEW